MCGQGAMSASCWRRPQTSGSVPTPAARYCLSVYSVSLSLSLSVSLSLSQSASHSCRLHSIKRPRRLSSLKALLFRPSRYGRRWPRSSRTASRPCSSQRHRQSETERCSLQMRSLASYQTAWPRRRRRRRPPWGTLRDSNRVSGRERQRQRERQREREAERGRERQRETERDREREREREERGSERQREGAT